MSKKHEYKVETIHTDGFGTCISMYDHYYGEHLESAEGSFEGARPQQQDKVIMSRREVTEWEVIQEREIVSQDTIVH